MRIFHNYFRGQLHRRLFLWFGASILLSGATVVLTTHAFEIPSVFVWNRETHRLGERFAEVWDSPEERNQLGGSLAHALGVDVVLTDPEGKKIISYGKECTRRLLTTEVIRGGQLLGHVSLCGERRFPHSPGRALVSLFVAGSVLWIASGFIARRLSRPLWELSRVAQELGAGRLSSRMRLPSQHRGEVRELRLLSESINDMAARIERQIADQRELLAAVSHELRTPLARIRLLVELIRTNGLEAKALEELEREVMEIDSLVGELLVSSRLDFAAITMHTLDAAEVAGRALERAGVDGSRLRPDTSDLAFKGDPNLLARALANMIENAKRHGGGVSALRVSSRPGLVIFEVEDQGPGFAPGEEAQAFQPFSRRSSTGRGESHSAGLGLGLALVRRIAEAHGGSASASNRPEGGAVVTLEVSSRGV